MRYSTIIIGGGMAGISCAMKLRERGWDFLMIADTLGGRVKYVAAQRVNLGAYFIINNYLNAKKILKKEKWLNTVDALFVNDDGSSFPTLSGVTLSLMPQVLKFVCSLLRFGHHYARFKRRCETTPHIEALSDDPYLASLSAMAATDFIAKRKLGKLYEAIVSKFAYACTLTPPRNLSAFDLMTVCQGMLVPMFKFSFDETAVAAMLSDSLVRDRVSGVVRKDDLYEVTTEGGKVFSADHVVMATPADVTMKLLGLARVRGHSSAYVLHIEGEPVEPFGKHAMNLFSPAHPISAITREHNGTCLLFSRDRNIDPGAYFRSWKLLSRADWDTALFVNDAFLLEQEHGGSCYIAGDHNSCGLEPACIAGIYAANRILGDNGDRRPGARRSIMKQSCVIFAGVIVAFVLAYLPFVSPFLLTRGATEREVVMRLPGDGLVPENPEINMTQAVTVNATPDRVWPWMAQIGQDRAGFYSFERLERLFGFGIRNTYRIVPEWQELNAGDFVKFHRNGIGMRVHSVEPGRCFVLLTDSRNPMPPMAGRREFTVPLPSGMYAVWNWSFNLKELPGGKTRLIVRCLADWPETNFALDWMLHFASEITGCVMNWQMINELKQCAEGEQDSIRLHL